MTFIREGSLRSVEQRRELAGDRTEVWLECKTRGGKKVTLVNIYRQWNSKEEDDAEALARSISRITGPVILGGDWNLDISRNYTGQSARALEAIKAACEVANLKQVSFGNTFCRQRVDRTLSSALDWFMVDCLLLESNWTSGWHDDGLSDHAAIYIEINIDEEVLPEVPRITKRDIKKISWPSFNIDLAAKPWEEIYDMTLEGMDERFRQFYKDTLDQHAPMKTVPLKRPRVPCPSTQLRVLRRERDKARYKGKKEEFKNLRNKCISLCRKETRAHTKKRILENPSEVWSIMRESAGRKRSPRVEVSCETTGEIMSDKMAADSFAQHFRQKVRTVTTGIPPTQGDPLEATRRRAQKLGIPKNAFTLRGCSEKEVYKVIKKMKNSAAADLDGLSPEILKKSMNSVLVPLTMMINKCLRDAKVPESWKGAKVTPLFKKGSRSLIKNYRPISIVKTASKVLEEIVRQQLVKHLDKYGIIPAAQHGFRRGRSTISAIGTAQHDWEKSLQLGQKAGLVSMDLTAAFDVLDRDLICQKLAIYGASKTTVDWFTSYLTGRWQHVTLNGERSMRMEVETGAPQGGSLSPVLMILITADIEEEITTVDIIMYADDTGGYAEAKTMDELKKKLEDASEAFVRYMHSNRLAINPSKTAYIIFSRLDGGEIEVDGHEITESKQQEFLGVTLNKQLNWTSHLQKLESELRSRVGVLRRLATQVDKETSIQLLQPLFTSKLRYAIDLTTDATLYNDNGDQELAIRKLQVLLNHAMRAVLGKPAGDRSKAEDLLRECRHPSVSRISLQAAAMMAWRLFSESGDLRGLTEGRLDKVGDREGLRSRSAGQLYTQKVQGTCLTRSVKIWNLLPDEMKTASNKAAARKALDKNIFIVEEKLKK